MNAREMGRYRRLLLEKQRQIAAAGAAAGARLPSAGGQEGDLMDQANADFEAELQIRLHQTDGRLERAIKEALARIRKRTFGVCATCGRPISKTRLDAVPWTRLCRECKEQEAA